MQEILETAGYTAVTLGAATLGYSAISYVEGYYDAQLDILLDGKEIEDILEGRSSQDSGLTDLVKLPYLKGRESYALSLQDDLDTEIGLRNLQRDIMEVKKMRKDIERSKLNHAQAEGFEYETNNIV